jgi:hypothetical protein
MASQNESTNKGSAETALSSASSTQSNAKIDQGDTSNTLSTVKTIQNMTTTEVTPPSGSPETDKFTLATSAKVDLNGDGIKEIIAVSQVKSSNPQDIEKFILKINNTSVEDAFEFGESFDGFAIVDIDKGDKYKEVAVHSPGPSDDDQYLIFWYDGSSIKKVGSVARWPRFAGNGIVYVNGWVSFWQNTDKYILTKQRTLQLVPQPLHYVGMKCKVKTGFPIYASQNSKSIIANLRTGSQIFVVLADISGMENGNTRYMIRSESNLLGWAKDDFIQNTDLQVAD